MKITTGPTGQIVHGHLLDVNVKHLTRQLQSYDPQLYVRWNPYKLKGWGCWELRRRPDQKQIVEEIEYKGIIIKRLEYVETDVIHHIHDAAYLNYDMVRWIKEADTRNKDHYINDLEYLEQKSVAEEQQKRAEHLRYLVKHNRKMFQDFKELVKSGKNPSRIVLGKDI